MSTRLRLACVAVTAAALTTFGGQAFADPIVGGDPTVTAVDNVLPVPPTTPDGQNLVAKPMPLPSVAPPSVPSVKKFVHTARQSLKLQKQIAALQRAAVKWSFVMGEHVSRSPFRRRLAGLSLPALQQQLRLTRKWENDIRVRAQHPPHMAQLMCIHYNPRLGHGEGPWNAHTGNGFYGGLQMNMGFMMSYGGWLLHTKGTADHWTPLEQMWVAERAIPSRGYYPWPLTARACGLI